MTRLYESLLEREPDASGMNANATAISEETMTAADVAVDIISSSEFKNKNYTNEVYVRKLYAGTFCQKSAGFGSQQLGGGFCPTESHRNMC